MPYFPLTTLQDMALAFFLGLGTLVLLYAAWTFYPPAPPEVGGVECEPEGVGSEEEQKKDDNPVPPFLIMAYLAVIVWALAYLILVGLGGKAIG